MSWNNLIRWTTERIDMLRKLWVTGMPASKIATEMGGITRNGVIGKAHRLGISEQHYDEGKPKLRRKHRRKPRPTAPPALPVIEPVIDLPPETSPDGCTIMELTERSCRWPIGNEPREMKFCGAQIWSGSYCRKHASVAWKSGGRV